MNLILIANIIACAGALGGFVFGAVRYFRPKEAAYVQMITFSAGVAFFGRLYQIIRMITVGYTVNQFHSGNLAVAGSLLFLFAANFGIMDSLGDDGSKELGKYRIIPIAAPVSAIALYVIFFPFSNLSVVMKIVTCVITLLAALASYFNLKHLILPDTDLGAVRCMRPFNLLALIYDFLCIAEFIMMTNRIDWATLAVCAVSGVIMPLIIIFADRGIKQQWRA